MHGQNRMVSHNSLAPSSGQSAAVKHGPDGNGRMNTLWGRRCAAPESHARGRKMSRGARWTLGSFALLFAVMFVVSERTAPSRVPLLDYLLVAFFGLIVVACFGRSWRGAAIRIIGGMAFFAAVS